MITLNCKLMLINCCNGLTSVEYSLHYDETYCRLVNLSFSYSMLDKSTNLPLEIIEVRATRNYLGADALKTWDCLCSVRRLQQSYKNSWFTKKLSLVDLFVQNVC